MSLLLCLCVATIPAAGHVAASCERISGLARVLHAPGVFVGDLHGTVQAPAFVKALLCHLLSSGRTAVLALQYPSNQQQFLWAFLHSHATDPKRALVASPFWSRPTQDGRTSRAMLQLLGWIRGQIARGARNSRHGIRLGTRRRIERHCRPQCARRWGMRRCRSRILRRSS